MKVFAAAAALVIDLYSLPPRPLPPVEYQNGTASLVVFVNSQEEMDQICSGAMKAKLREDYIFVGCAARTKNGTPFMFVSNPCNYPEDLYARSVCHEMGHINGWVHANPPTEQTSPQTHPSK